ncbi:Neuropeptide FF receptor 2 [Branchiostoma belcheri]|nr:Neuropeptide FF receptor 2 [Branchiostoma belcheri]
MNTTAWMFSSSSQASPGFNSVERTPYANVFPSVTDQTAPYGAVPSAEYVNIDANVTVFNFSSNGSVATLGPPPPNTCPDGFFCREYRDLAQILAVQVFFIVFYVAIISLAVVGNAMVLWTVWRNKKLRTVTNYFILNLAATDLVVGMFVAVFKLLEFASPVAVDVFSVPLCTALNFLQPVFVGASMLTLVAVSFERFNAICRPLDTKFTSKKRIVAMLVTVWVVPMVLCSLQLIPAAFFRMRLRSELGTITRARCLDDTIHNPHPNTVPILTPSTIHNPHPNTVPILTPVTIHNPHPNTVPILTPALSITLTLTPTIHNPHPNTVPILTPALSITLTLTPTIHNPHPNTVPILTPAPSITLTLTLQLDTMTLTLTYHHPCTPIPNTIGDPTWYHVTLFLVLYALPLLFISVVCVRIVLKLRAMETPGSQLVNDRDMARKRDKNKKMVTRMVIAVAAAFAVCWTPFYVMNMSALNPATNFIANGNLFFWNTLMYGLGFLNSAINPVIYIVMSDKFRRGFRDLFYTVFCCLPCRKLCRCPAEIPHPKVLSHSSTSAPNQSHSTSPRRNLAAVHKNSPKLVKRVSFAKDLTLTTTVSNRRMAGIVDTNAQIKEADEEKARASPGVKRKTTWKNPARERRWLKLSWRKITKRVSSRSNADSGVYSITGEPPDIATHEDLCNDLPPDDDNHQLDTTTRPESDITDSVSAIHVDNAIANVDIHIDIGDNSHAPEETAPSLQDCALPEGFEIAPGYDQYSSEEEDTVPDFSDIPDFQEYCYTLAPALPKKPLKRGFRRTSASLTNAVEV